MLILPPHRAFSCFLENVWQILGRSSVSGCTRSTACSTIGWSTKRTGSVSLKSWRWGQVNSQTSPRPYHFSEKIDARLIKESRGIKTDSFKLPAIKSHMTSYSTSERDSPRSCDATEEVAKKAQKKFCGIPLEPQIFFWAFFATA